MDDRQSQRHSTVKASHWRNSYTQFDICGPYNDFHADTFVHHGENISLYEDKSGSLNLGGLDSLFSKYIYKF